MNKISDADSVGSTKSRTSSSTEDTSSADVSIAGPSSRACIISDGGSESSSGSTFVVPAAKKAKRQAFREAWLQNPYFKSWLQQTDDSLRVECTVCSKLLRAKKDDLEKHAKSHIHIKNLQQKAGASISARSNAAINSSNSENDSSRDSTFVVPAAKKAKRQAFREAWLQNACFKPWLQQTDDPLRVKCTVCSKLLRAKKDDLEKHAKSHIHIKNLQQKAEASISARSNVAISCSDSENASSADVSIAGPSSSACIISHGDSASSSDGTIVVPAAKKAKRQAFREAWLQYPHFKPWLKRADDPLRAKCTVCSKLLKAKIDGLETHAKSVNHTINMFHRIESLTSAHKRTFSDEIKEAEDVQKLSTNKEYKATDVRRNILSVAKDVKKLSTNKKYKATGVRRNTLSVAKDVKKLSTNKKYKATGVRRNTLSVAKDVKKLSTNKKYKATDVCGNCLSVAKDVRKMSTKKVCKEEGFLVGIPKTAQSPT